MIVGINDLATLEPLLVKQWSKKNKIKPTEVSIGSHKKVIWRCEKGEPSGQGRWLIMCPYWLDMCPCKKSLKVQEKSFQACVCVYLNAIELKKEWWRGACGHEWQASVKARSNGEKCPICSGARVIAGINDLATLEPLLVKQWSKKNKIKPTEV